MDTATIATNPHASQPRTHAAPSRETLAVFGATRGVGLRLVAQALAAGHRVRALVRDPRRFALTHPRLEVLGGDALDPAAVLGTLEGADAVICALGAPALSRSKVRSEGTTRIVRAMEETGQRRLICVSVLGARESREGLPFFLRYVIFPLYLRRAVAEHERQERVLEESGLDWTAVRPPTLTDGPPTGAYAFGFEPPEMGRLTLDISRADVAHFMLEELGADAHVGRTVGISYRK